MYKKPVLAIQIKGALRYKTEIHIAHCQSSMGGNKARFTAHYLYQPDTVNGVVGLSVGRRNGFYRFCYCGIKTEGPLNKAKIIINGFGNTDYRDVQFSPFKLFRHLQGPPLGPISTDGEEHTDVHPFDCIGNLYYPVAAAAGGFKDGTALGLNIINNLGVQLNRFKTCFRQETAVSILYTGNSFYSISIPQASYYRPNHIV